MAAPEATRLNKAIDAWWPEVDTSITTMVWNAHTKAANTTTKHIKRTGHGFPKHDNYRCRITIISATPSAI